ncbi:unconventional prefoldin RPB5 interactor 1 isoform X1 [Arapaima gigas]
MAERGRRHGLTNPGRLREEHEKVVSSCKGQIQHWSKVKADYGALEERLRTLPDRLSYDVMIYDLRAEIRHGNGSNLPP